jgi:GT2 family glycosyltransferase
LNSFEKNICVIIPTHNRLKTTLKCVTSLSSIDSQLPIIICDSNSTDGTVDSISQFSNVTVVPAFNNWWTGACNLGIDYALNNKFDLLVILNDDIDFNSNLIELLLQKHEQYPEHIISAYQDTPTGPFLGFNYHGLLKTQKLISVSSSDVFVDSSNGCCLLVPSHVFYTIGLLDAVNCPHLYADTVFQLKAKKSGFKTIAIPSILIKQHESTDYISRINLNTIFTFPGSPFHIRSFLEFGQVLFNGKILFFLFGFKYILSYIRALVTSFFILFFRP